MEEDEIDLRECVTVLYRKKWTLLAITFLFAVTAGIVSLLLPKTYQSESVIQNAVIEGETLATKSAIEFMVKSSRILQPVLEDYNKKYNKSVEMIDFKNNILAADFNDGRFSLFVRSDSPESAVMINKRVIEEYFRYYQKRFDRKVHIIEEKMALLDDSIEKIDKSGGDLKQEISSFTHQKQLVPEPAFKAILLRSLYAQYVNDLTSLNNQKFNFLSTLNKIDNYEILEEPFSNDKPVFPKKRKMVIIAGFAGLIVGMLFIYLSEYLRNS